MGIYDDFENFKGSISPKRFDIYLDGTRTTWSLKNDMVEQYIYNRQVYDEISKAGGELNEDQRIPVSKFIENYSKTNVLRHDPLFNLLDLDGIDPSYLVEGLDGAEYVDELREIHVYSKAYRQLLEDTSGSNILSRYINERIRRIHEGAILRYNYLMPRSMGICGTLLGKFTGLLFIPSGFEGLYLDSLSKNIERYSMENSTVGDTGIKFIAKFPNAIPHKADNTRTEYESYVVHRKNLMDYFVDPNMDKDLTIYNDIPLSVGVIQCIINPELSQKDGVIYQLGNRVEFSQLEPQDLKKDTPSNIMSYAKYMLSLRPYLQGVAPNFENLLRRIHE